MFNIFKNEKANHIPKRYWDFSYADRFFEKNKLYIDLFELRMFHDDNVCERFMEDGLIVKTIGGSYQMYSGNIDGVVYTTIDIPCIHVVYNGGHEEWIACYMASSENFGESHRKLIKGEF